MTVVVFKSVRVRFSLRPQPMHVRAVLHDAAGLFAGPCNLVEDEDVRMSVKPAAAQLALF